MWNKSWNLERIGTQANINKINAKTIENSLMACVPCSLGKKAV